MAKNHYLCFVIIRSGYGKSAELSGVNRKAFTLTYSQPQPKEARSIEGSAVPGGKNESLGNSIFPNASQGSSVLSPHSLRGMQKS